MFTSSSIRGRGTTVLCASDLNCDEEKRLALKISPSSWQDFEWESDRDDIMNKVGERGLRPNAIVPLKVLNAKGNEKTRTTLASIGSFLDEQIDHVYVENRSLTYGVTVSEWRRPVKYFWGVHDFVRGLRGALLGHEFLTKNGILHGDISENNIALALYPWEDQRGYLIDFDTASLQEAAKPTRISSTESNSQLDQPAEKTSTKVDGKKLNVKEFRTGIIPYVSFYVLPLNPEGWTYFDDMESFLYVLLFFFYLYAGPLSKEELKDAHEKGFVGSRRLSHARNWPGEYVTWIDGNLYFIRDSKRRHILKAGDYAFWKIPEHRDILKKNWPEALYPAIKSLLVDSFKVFSQSVPEGASVAQMRSEVSHTQFLDVLDKWLVANSALESEYSNCPDFKDFRALAPLGLCRKME